VVEEDEDKDEDDEDDMMKAVQQVRRKERMTKDDGMRPNQLLKPGQLELTQKDSITTGKLMMQWDR
jgi:hypothetical protein